MAAKKKSKKTLTPSKSKSKSKVAKKKAAPPPPKKVAVPSKTLGETLLRAITIAIISDGEIGEAEEQMLIRFSRAPLFKGLKGSAIVQATIKQCIASGPDAIYDDIASKLTTKEAREAAFTSCVAATASDGKLTASEVKMLFALKDAFSITTARAKSLAGPLGAIFR